jgi:hypothetical protein
MASAARMAALRASRLRASPAGSAACPSMKRIFIVSLVQVVVETEFGSVCGLCIVLPLGSSNDIFMNTLFAAARARPASRSDIGWPCVVVDVDVAPVHLVEVRVGEQFLQGAAAHGLVDAAGDEGGEVGILVQRGHVFHGGQRRSFFSGGTPGSADDESGKSRPGASTQRRTGGPPRPAQACRAGQRLRQAQRGAGRPTLDVAPQFAFSARPAAQEAFVGHGHPCWRPRRGLGW